MCALNAAVGREGPDFRIRREEARHWTIRALTPRASHWMRANFADHCAEEDQIIKTDLINANALISKARSVGLLTEYVGPDATSYF